MTVKNCLMDNTLKNAVALFIEFRLIEVWFVTNDFKNCASQIIRALVWDCSCAGTNLVTKSRTTIQLWLYDSQLYTPDKLIKTCKLP